MKNQCRMKTKLCFDRLHLWRIQTHQIQCKCVFVEYSKTTCFFYVIFGAYGSKYNVLKAIVWLKVLLLCCSCSVLFSVVSCRRFVSHCCRLQSICPVSHWALRTACNRYMAIKWRPCDSTRTWLSLTTLCKTDCQHGFDVQNANDNAFSR